MSGSKIIIKNRYPRWIFTLFFSGACLIILLLSNVALAQDQPTDDQEKSKGVNIVVTQSPKIIVNVDAVSHNQCFGESKGAINISASGGYPPYKYYWSHGDTTQDVAGLKAGLYKVAVYDDFSCSDTVEIEINEPKRLAANIESVRDILCYGYNNGAVDISVEGGTPPYTYSWNNGATTQDIEGVNSGRYSVLITDANNCQEIVTADVKEKPLIIRSLDDVSNILCNGDTTGKIDISVSGGVPPYSYKWSNGGTTQDLENLKAGDYDVVVEDDAGCTEVSTVKVKQPDALTVSFDEIKDLRCNGDFGGAINIDVDGGVTPYAYEWNNGATSQDIAGISAGEYEVKVTDDNGCKNSISTEITQPSALSVDLVSLNDVKYNGGSDGSIDITVSGGVAPYTYKWSNGSEEQDISGLTAGNYNVRVTDNTGCAKIMNVTITQPQSLVISIDNTKNINCYDAETGEIEVSVIGGIPPYSYSWSNGATTQDISNLKAGRYTVTVTDANGYEQKTDTLLTQPPAFNARVDSTENILCHGEHTGSIDVHVEGGVPPYKYRWSSGQITQDLNNVPAGNYSLKITDANFCEQSVSSSITEPQPLQLELVSSTNIKCFGDSTGAVDISVTGGEAPYAYKWNTGQTTEDIQNIPAGEYVVTVTDANGCSQKISTEITEPNLLSISESLVTNVDCKGNNTGSIALEVSGGTTPYNYEWNTGATTKNISNIPAGSYDLVVTDANGCSDTYATTIAEPEELVRSLEEVSNILCYGDVKGAIDINVSGGVEPYKYMWNNGTTTQDIVDVKAGFYSVKITDANGCEDTISARITENPLLSPTVDVSNIKCNGQNSGEVDLTVEGGVAPYKYRWSNEATSQDISELQAGNYSVIIEDAVGCTEKIDAQISEPPKFMANLETKNDILCNGNSTGNISVRVTGGVKPYSYNWSNGATTQNITDVPAGTYTLETSDANGCTRTVQTTITQPTKVEFGIKNVTNVLCYNDNTGAIDVTVAGGVGPYTYKWNNGDTTQDISNVKAGRYSVQLSDANGCVQTLDAEITQPPNLVLNIDSISHIECFGEEKGAIDLNVVGGKAPYLYSWSNGATTQDIENVQAGDYTVTVTDDNGCSSTIGATIKEPPQLRARIAEIKQINCYGDTDGAVSIQVAGGVKPYSYDWSNGARSQNIENLGAGTYSVTITDRNGCSQSLEAVIDQPPQLISELTNTRDVSCFEGQNGLVNITVQGGTTPYKYNWNNGATSQDLTGITAGTYAVGITDANGCKDSSIVATINEPDLLNVRINQVTNITQYGLESGAIDLYVSGGVPPYQYSWSNGSTSQDIESIPAGNYSVIVKDKNGCEKFVEAKVDQPPPLSIKIASIDDIKCNGTRNGNINIDVTGGVPPYTFAWSNGDSTQNLTNVKAGQYTVRVTDRNGYTQSVSANIAQPSPLVVTIDEVNNLLCYNDSTGAINVTATGGVKPYQFQWSNGETTDDISNLDADSYELTVTDSYGCQNTITAEVTQPDLFTAVIDDVRHINCKGDNKGEVHLEVNGGVKPYNFFWSNGARSKDITDVIAGEYSAKITDANGCINEISTAIKEPPKLVAKLGSVTNNKCYGESDGMVNIEVTGGVKPYNYAWSNGDTTQNLTSVPKGDYSVTVTDAKGCQQIVEATVTEPTLLSASIDEVENVKCFGDQTGSISVSVSGGTEPYVYNWNNGVQERNLNNIPAGNYVLNVEDANGCVSTIETEISQPDRLTLNLDTVNHIKCYGDNKGFIDITVKGGVFPYQYVWSNGEESEDLVDVLAGDYTVKVKDVNGCTESMSATIKQPERLSLTLDSIENNNCSGDATGYVSVNASGGKGPYSYLWNNGSTSNFVQDVAAGTYKATATDANGCKTTLTTEVTEPTNLVKTIDAITDIRCNGDSTGSINVTVREGSPPYSFKWSNGAETEDIRGVTAGDYKLTITESNGCVSTLEASIEEPSTFNAKINSVTDVECFGDNTGAIDISVSGGVEPYTFTWSNGAESEDIDSVTADSYSVMISDGNGCLKTLNTEIQQPAELSMRIDSVHNVKCCGDNSGAIFITVTGGVEPYDYKWSNGATTEDIQNLILGNYTVNVTDANGCEVGTPDDMTLYEQVVSQGKFTTRDIHFDVGKSIIKPESFSTINKIATFMKEHPDISFRIDGHTDSDGSDELNQRLSEERAGAIRSALIKFGIRASRLKSKGWGESNPVATNRTEEGKAQNRRVEFVVLTGTLDGTFTETAVRENLEE